MEYVRQQVKLKIDLARGIDFDSQAKKKPTLQERFSKPKKLLESYDFRSVFRFMVQQILSTSGSVRIGFISTTNYFVRSTCAELSKDDFEWLLRHVLDIMEEPSVLALNNDDSVFFRSRIGYILRTIGSSLNETQQLNMASLLCLYLASMDKRSDNSLHIALAELADLIVALQENAASIADNTQAAATIHLHSSSFAVRAQSAYLLSALSLAVPLLAVEILRQSLKNAIEARNQLTSAEFVEKLGGGVEGGLTLKNPSAVKLLNKMFFFHGHILVMATVLKNEGDLPVGLSESLIFDVFDFGLELLQYDVLSAPAELRQVQCNLVRAGSLLISACVSLGSGLVKQRIRRLTQCCAYMISVSLSTAAASASEASSYEKAEDDSLLFEMLVIESAVFSLSSVLWYCSEVAHNDKEILDIYASCVNKAYKAVVEIYSEKYKSHYRFRTLHVVLTECYTMLPPSMCSVAIFNSAFQTFRGFTLAGVESELFSKLSESKRVFEILATEGSSSATQNKTIWKSQSMDITMLRLETNTYALHLKEGEASVASFKNKFSYSYEKEINIQLYSPCARIEARSVDAAAAMLAIIFSQETKENQEKLIQFCVDAINQALVPGSQLSNNLFATEEEKRRKVRLCLTTLKNCVFVFYSVINQYTFPPGLSAYDQSLSWIHAIADSMISLLNHSDYDVRISASYTVSLLVHKVNDYDVTESISRKVLGILSLVNDAKGDKIDWNSYNGYFIVLSTMWTSIERRFQTKEDITKVSALCHFKCGICRSVGSIWLLKTYRLYVWIPSSCLISAHYYRFLKAQGGAFGKGGETYVFRNCFSGSRKASPQCECCR